MSAGGRGPTPSQTIGPFFRFGTEWLARHDLVAPGSAGALALCGRVLDGAGTGLPDAMVEIWQADPTGGFPDAATDAAGAWTGFGRSLTDGDGRFAFTTVKPGRVDARQAPHVDVTVFARGLLQRLVTRLYFPDEPETNAADPVLARVEPARRPTLVAQPDGDGGLRFDIRLQGPDETVFFAW